MASLVSAAPPPKYFKANADILSLSSTYALSYLVCISEKDFSQNRTIMPLLYLKTNSLHLAKMQAAFRFAGLVPTSLITVGLLESELWATQLHSTALSLKTLNLQNFFNLFLVVYLLKNPVYLSCKMSHLLDFDDCNPVSSSFTPSRHLPCVFNLVVMAICRDFLRLAYRSRSEKGI